MSKLQRIIIIVAAFGIISLVLTQTDTNANSNSQVVPQTAIVQVNSNNTYADTQTNTKNTLPFEHAQQTDVFTNIYQTQSGSFYFIESIAAPVNATTNAKTSKGSLEPLSQLGYQASRLLSTHADIRITGPIARTRLTQVFENDSNNVRSGIYVFPLPQDAAVDHLLMTVGDRKIEGEIKRKEIAKKQFAQAKAQGQKASLVAQIRPNMFSNQIANIPPHSRLSVTIEYQQYIVQDKHSYALRLPLSITPRYSPSDDKSNIELLPENPTLPANTTIDITLNTGLPISHISSEHHPIKIVNTYDTEYQIALDTTQPANKDFVLNWQMKTGYSIQASHFTYQSDNYEYGLITLVPPSSDHLNAKRNLVFILDVSGSMVGASLEQAKQSLAIAIDDLKPDDYFNLVAFSSDATRMWSQSQKATENAKNEALTFIYGLEANGGTEIKPALEMAFAMPTITNEASDYLNQIIFITDASVSNEDELMRTIYQQLGEYRLFTVGIGSAPNAHFMTEAASAGKGTFTFIGDIQNVKPKMARLLDKLKKPALTQLQLNIKDAKHALGFEIYPSKLPDLYADEPLVISYRQQRTNTPTSAPIPFSLSGEYLSPTASGNLQTRKWSTQLPAVSAERKHGIHKYWARLKIKDLQQQFNMRSRDSEGYQAMQANIKEAITNVALSHHLVSKYTSLIAIERKLKETSTAYAVSRPLHSLQLAQYKQAQLLQTASTSGLQAFIGCLLICMSLLLLHVRKKANPNRKGC